MLSRQAIWDAAKIMKLTICKISLENKPSFHLLILWTFQRCVRKGLSLIIVRSSRWPLDNCWKHWKKHLQQYLTIGNRVVALLKQQRSDSSWAGLRLLNTPKATRQELSHQNRIGYCFSLHDFEPPGLSLSKTFTQEWTMVSWRIYRSFVLCTLN